LKADSQAEVINRMVRVAHDLDFSIGRDLQVADPARAQASREAQEAGYFRIASILNKLPLLARRELGARLIAKAAEARRIGAPRFMSAKVPDGHCMAFVVSELPRTQRLNLLTNVLVGAIASFRHTEGLGVAVRDLSGDWTRFDYLWIDHVDPDDLDNMACAKLLGEQQVVHADDFPTLRRDLVLPPV
jgi:hypothetical protein